MPPSDRSGVALVLVMSCLFLIVILIVSLLGRVGSEQSTSDAYSATVSARQLSEMAVNLVEGQITTATTQGAAVTWASQPGMIRTYGTAGNTSEANTGTNLADLLRAYKLYSATTMVGDTVSMTAGSSSAPPRFTEDYPPASWSSQSALWTDINEPIILSTMDSSGNFQKSYPIMDPTAGSTGTGALNVEGFSSHDTAFSAQMPLRWMYVLQQGQIIAPDAASSATQVTFAGAATVPSATNPIVGRIAFWADDDTCKININTAGYGKVMASNNTVASASNPTTTNGYSPELYFDTPRFGTYFDRNYLAFAQPATHEYTRYPGHPATTSLTAVFPLLAMKDALTANLAPRYQWGGTDGGSQQAADIITLANPGNRLFATVDEFIYDPSRVSTATTSKMSPDDLRKLRFFLTANNSAPETNLYNLPRIACWPVADSALGSSYRTGYDNLIAFAASTKSASATNPTGLPYYFQRHDSTSSTADLSKSAPYSQRNAALYSYLQWLTSGTNPIPGFGNSFQNKYGLPERNQILTSVLDYIRCTNLFDDNLAQGRQFTSGVAYTQAKPPGAFWQPPGYGQVMPLRHSDPTNSTQGFGRFYTVSQVAVHFICTADGTGMREARAGSSEDPTKADTAYTGVPAKVEHLGTVAALYGETPNEALIDNDAKLISNVATAAGSQNYVNKTLGGVRLNANQKKVQAMIHLQLFSPELGNRALVPDMQVTISGLETLKVTTTDDSTGLPVERNLNFPDTIANLPLKIQADANHQWLGKDLGGNPGVRLGLMPNGVTQTSSAITPPADSSAFKRAYFGSAGAQYSDNGANTDPSESGVYMNTSVPNSSYNPYNVYPFISLPVTIYTPASGGPGTMTFSGGDITVSLYGNASTAPSPGNLIQTIKVKLPTGTFPVPNLVSTGTGNLSAGYLQNDGSSIYGLATNRSFWWSLTKNGVTTGMTGADGSTVQNQGGGQYLVSGWNFGRLSGFSRASQMGTFTTPTTYAIPAQNVAATPMSPAFFRGGNEIVSRVSPALGNVDLGWPAAPPGANVVSFPAQTAPPNNRAAFTHGFDVVRSMIANHGDYRHVAGLNSVGDTVFKSHPSWNNTVVMFACNLWENAPLERLPTFPASTATPVGTTAAPLAADPSVRLTGTSSTVTYGQSPGGGAMAPDMPPGYTTSTSVAQAQSPAYTGDFDNGVFGYPDGAYINKPDEGNAWQRIDGVSPKVPYYDDFGYSVAQGRTLFSPNRMLPSPGMFGSIPTGLQRGQPWQTLLLRPQLNHPNEVSPPDHLLLDLFWMPVVDPYAISEPFATAGKVNMNYQMMPFTWVERSTALRAVLKGERMTAVPNSQAQYYKSSSGLYDNTILSGATPTYRLGLNIANTPSSLNNNDTIQAFYNRMSGGDIFRSATEVCDLPMVPEGQNLSGMTTFWSNYQVTGDDSRERIYATLLPRLTTKSNSFTVHVRAQVLQKVPGTAPAQWIQGKDVVKGEYRGSTAIQRYIDPNTVIPDYAADAQNNNYSEMQNKPLDVYYRWRQLQTIDFNN